MYRYCVDNAVTYTSEDIVLFRESPFACWMERLTLENPDHGIQPDPHSTPPADYIQPQDELAETLRFDQRDVELVDWEAGEPERRTATLHAMRRGVDFIVNGQLALGPLSGASNLLMRTSGYSELGNFLYVPCDTQAKTTLNSAFRLCFLADLLHSLQGQLPPQMLIIRGGSDIVPLRTEDHIYHYRAVKQRFMRAMREFRKHRMPDPADSAYFGRWTECALEVVKQRALRAEAEHLDEAADELFSAEEVEVLSSLESAAAPAPRARLFARAQHSGAPVFAPGETPAAGARESAPTAFSGDRATPAAGDMPRALEDLEEAYLERLDFIRRDAGNAPPDALDTRHTAQVPEARPAFGVGAGFDEPEPIDEPPVFDMGAVLDTAEPPDEPPVFGMGAGFDVAKSTREPPAFDVGAQFDAAEPADEPPVFDLGVGFDATEPTDEPPACVTDAEFDAAEAAPRPRPHPLDSHGFSRENRYDIEPPRGEWVAETPSPRLNTDGHEFDIDCIDDSDYHMPGERREQREAAVPPAQEEPGDAEEDELRPPRATFVSRPFSSSLITGDGLDDED